MIPNFKDNGTSLSLLFLSAILFDCHLSAKEIVATKTLKKEKINSPNAVCNKCGNYLNADAKAEKEMKPYKLKISQTEVHFEMVPIRGGMFIMGSPDNEKGRKKDEGPQHKVKVEPFWMGKYEVTWDEYDVWTFDLDVANRLHLKGVKPTPCDADADAITRPSKPYMDMTFGYGHDRYPAICATQLAAKVYCEWLSAKTGHYYRLPTEAEWEYACRAGTKSAYSFGDDIKKLDDYAWHEDNSDFELQEVGKKKPNPWGLHDMHGNVAEWCLDKYDAGFYREYLNARTKPLLNVPNLKNRYGRVTRGGSWNQPPIQLRSSVRMKSISDWKETDPQNPKSDWYLTDVEDIGFRIVRPLKIPAKADRRKWMLNSVKEEIDRMPSHKKRTAGSYLKARKDQKKIHKK